MGIDTSKIRVGDEVVLIGTVSSLSGVYVGVNNRFTVCREEIVEHLPKPREIKVGDIVRRVDGEERRRVLHIIEGEAWLEGLGVLWPVSKLRHAD